MRPGSGLPVHEVVFEGKPDFRLAIGVSGYEFRGATSGDDADWLMASLDLQLAGTTKMKIKNDPFLRAEELMAFNSELRELLAGKAASAELATMEDHIDLRITRSGGETVAEGSVTDHVHVEVDFKEVRLDPASVAGAQAQLDALLRAFPSRYPPPALEQ